MKIKKKRWKNKRKNKKKKILLFTLIFIMIIAITSGIFLLGNHQIKIKKETNKNPRETTEQIITNILSYNTEEVITEEFLTWINQTYNKKVLKEINKSLKENNYNKNLWHSLTKNSLTVLLDQYNKKYDTATNVTIKEAKQTSITTLNFIGDVSLADNWYIMKEYDKRKQKVLGILDQNIIDIFKQDDITIANNEFTISDRGAKLPNKYYTFRASPSRLSIYQEMNVDFVTLANNHIYDYGELAFQDSLAALKQYNIPYVGAGKDIEEAKQPYYFIINGYKIAFVNATRAEKYILTPEATTTSGGVLRCYDPTTFINVIEETKKTSDYLVALVHWGKEDSTQLETVQVDTAKQYIEAGADIIIGTHAHTLQGIDFYNNKAIIYNLGDFIFNHEDKDTAIFQLRITQDGNLEYKMIPCHQKDKYTYSLEGEDKIRVLNTLRNLSPNINIDENGEITPK